MADISFEDYLKEREMLDKKRSMEQLMKEFKEDMRRKKVMEQKQMVMSDDANERLLEKIYEDFLEEGFSPEEAAKKAKEEFEKRAMATGGRAGYQTGGITETRQLPPEFIEAAQKTFLADLTRQAGLPTVTTAETQQPGETAEQFAARQAQAQQFGITRAGMAEVAPKVADETALQQQARDLASGL